ncbi:MAG: FAD-dependent monooxygenase [Sulfuritalea sp.]|nr:FAD-dependent monooxygenase [Sulfuritalea sp.]
MKIRIIGGGPAGLYFASLMKREDPAHDIVIYERGPRNATWGFGVVFSDRALDFLHADDKVMYRLLTPLMETWPNLTIVHDDTRIPIAGNGFAAIGRLDLLSQLYTHTESLGVKLQFDSEISSLADTARLGGADLIVAANGAFSWIRNENEDKFGTETDLRSNHFIWYGTSKAFDSLSLTFRNTEHGVFCAHHYRYSPTMSTFLVEVTDATWQRAGFAEMSDEETIRHCERVFAADLDGEPILSNKSFWRQFPAISNRQWSFGNVVLMGDALRTAHFSIGSGTRLAMEDAIALWKALRETGSMAEALALYQQRRLAPMQKILDAANVSIRWYEEMDQLMALPPVDFAYSYMTRTGRVDHAEVWRRDPALARAYEAAHPDLA